MHEELYCKSRENTSSVQFKGIVIDIGRILSIGCQFKIIHSLIIRSNMANYSCNPMKCLKRTKHTNLTFINC